jgi:hypothetical protein
MRGRRSGANGWRMMAAVGLVGIVLGANLIAPAGAHVAGWDHNWKEHVRPKADPRYANAVSGTDKAKNADKLDGVDSTGFYAASSKVADSDLLDGLDSSVVKGGFDAQTVTTSTTLTSTVTDVASITVDAPSDGFVILTGNGMFTATHTNGTGDFLRVWLTTASGTANFNNLTFYEVPSSAPTGVFSVPFSITRIFPATAGPNNFYMTADKNSGTGSLFRHNLTGIFSATQL